MRSGVAWNPFEPNSLWRASAIFAPQNQPKVEAAFREERNRWKAAGLDVVPDALTDSGDPAGEADGEALGLGIDGGFRLRAVVLINDLRGNLAGGYFLKQGHGSVGFNRRPARSWSPIARIRDRSGDIRRSDR